MKPILFNTEMVRAIQEGRKTVTRRVIKPQPTWIDCGNGKDNVPMQDIHIVKNNPIKPPYHPGDILYVRETWQYAYDMDGNDQFIEGTGRYLYAADNGTLPFGDWIMPDGTHRENMPWRPSIHMPKEAARLFLRVTGVRVERLLDATDEDAQNEGFHDRGELIDAIHRLSPEAGENPWVWVIEFERISREAALGGGEGG